jgi:polar amino acid transport system substrate-binding protein
MPALSFPSRRRARWMPVAILLVAIAAVSLYASTQGVKLRLVSTAWTPFTNETGQPRFALDLVEAAFTRIGVAASTTIVQPAQFTTMLLSGPYEGSGAAWRDAERERALVYSRPYLENRLILVGRRGTSVTATKLPDLKGKRIAIVEGYAYGDDFEKSGPTFVRSHSEEDSLKMLLDGRVDYTLMDDLVVMFIVTNYPDEARSKLQLGSTPLVTRPLYVAVRRTLPDAESIVSRFNEQLRNMIIDRTYHQLLHVEWISADVDGDGKPENVPQSDQAGTTAPRRVYELFSGERALGKPGSESQRYYIGGYFYNSWSDVPDTYKVSVAGRKDPKASTLSVFTFTWK